MALFSVSDHPEVDRLVETCGYAAAALTILPIPGSEILGVMPLHVGMVIGIANHRGRTLTRESATSLLLQIGGTVGLSLVGSRIATFAAKVILPGLGGFVAAPFMYASTLAIGAVADAFFKKDGKLDEHEMREVYNRAVREAKATFRADKMKEKAAMDRAAEAVAEGKAAEAAGGAAPAPAAPAPAPQESPLDKMKHAKDLLDQGFITLEEYEDVKKRVLGELSS